MSEREEYTPSMDHVRNRYARIMKTDGTVALAIRWQKEFDRAIAAHDRALREEVAREIEATETLLLHVEDFDKHRESIQGQINGIRAAARIARGEEQTDE